MNTGTAWNSLAALVHVHVSPSFVLDRSTQLFGRRERYIQWICLHGLHLMYVYSKILTAVVSSFTAHYVHLWSTYFGNVLLSPPLPSFDGRVVAYPSMQNLRDYVSWRQADCETAPLQQMAGTSADIGEVTSIICTTPPSGHWSQKVVSVQRRQRSS